MTVLVVKTYQMTVFYNICLSINENINNIINSEDYLLEAYLTYKNHYLFSVKQNVQSEINEKYENMMADLKERMTSQKEIDFTKYTLEAVNLFRDINGPYVE